MIKSFALITAFTFSVVNSENVQFINYDFNDVSLCDTNSTSNSDESKFNKIGTLDTTTIIKYKDGYVTYSVEIYKLELSSTTNLFYVHACTIFVLGYTADISDSYFDGERRLGTALVSMKLEQYVSEDKKGPSITKLYAWPCKQAEFTTVTTSSHSGSFSFGNSTSVKIGNDELSITRKYSYGLTYSFSSTLQTSFTDPVVSHIYNADDTSQDEWTISVSNVSEVGKHPFQLDSYVMFETNTKNVTNCNKDAFVLNYGANMTCKYKTIVGWQKGSKKTYNVSIGCFL